jgi:hypothetical protein
MRDSHGAAALPTNVLKSVANRGASTHRDVPMSRPADSSPTADPGFPELRDR